MQASTDRACFRKLSDWVNSVSKHHAVSRSIVILILECSKYFARTQCGITCQSPRTHWALAARLKPRPSTLLPVVCPRVYLNQGFIFLPLHHTSSSRCRLCLTSTGVVPQITLQVGNRI